MHFNKRQRKEQYKIKVAEIRAKVIVLTVWFVRKYPSAFTFFIYGSNAISKTFLLHIQLTTIRFHFYFLSFAISSESATAFNLVESVAGALKESLTAGAPASLYNSPCGAFPVGTVPLNDFI